MSRIQCFLRTLLFVLLVSSGINAAEIKDELLRTYTYLDLAECLEDFREREFFEFMYRYAHIERTPQHKFMVGLLYHHGLGTERDFDKARRWYKEASAGGYQFEPYLGREADAALRSLPEPETADSGHQPAMTPLELEFASQSPAGKLQLATQYLYGLCAPMDYDKGREWEIAAAEGGSREAILSVSENYRYGQFGYPIDTIQADMWKERLLTADLKPQSVVPPARKPALPGEQESMSKLLGDIFSETMREAGTPPADVKPVRDNTKPQSLGEYAGDIFEDGMRHYRAGEYYRAGLEFVEAAAFGIAEPECHFLLAEIQMGLCGDVNSYGAGKSYRIAADMGHRVAMVRLAYLHEEGMGVRRSLDQARLWYSRAGDIPEAREGLARVDKLLADGGAEDWQSSEEFRRVLADAQFRAGFNYSPFRMKDEMTRATGYLLKAADNGHPYAQYLAARLYKVGAPEYGVTADPGRAAVLLEEAARAGVREAAAMRGTGR